ncbi:MAG: hypothetical protein HRT57_16325 [Crocinitomicaceae bacterium]|nr:hypothetical protein [Crocinitomicaceae bacterium]
MKVFLGGTVNGSNWRDKVKDNLLMDYFDPVVDDWNDEAFEIELKARENCEHFLYVITPKMTGYYAVAEVTDDSFHNPYRTVFCYLKEDEGDSFSEDQIAELEYLGRVVVANGAIWLKDLDEVTSYLNSIKSVR